MMRRIAHRIRAIWHRREKPPALYLIRWLNARLRSGRFLAILYIAFGMLVAGMTAHELVKGDPFGDVAKFIGELRAEADERAEENRGKSLVERLKHGDCRKGLLGPC